MNDREQARGRVLTAAVLRPRGLLLLAGGAFASLLLALVAKWYLLFAGLFMTAGAYLWSVSDSLKDRRFIEEMSRPALQAAPSDDTMLVVAAHEGSRLLEGRLRDEHRELARAVLEVSERLSSAAFEYPELLQDAPSDLAALVSLYEKLGVESLRLKASGEGDGARSADVEAAMEELRGKILELCGRVSGLTGVSPEEAKRLAEELVSDIAAVEDTVGGIKSLEGDAPRLVR